MGGIKRCLSTDVFILNGSSTACRSDYRSRDKRLKEVVHPPKTSMDCQHIYTNAIKRFKNSIDEIMIIYEEESDDDDDGGDDVSNGSINDRPRSLSSISIEMTSPTKNIDGVITHASMEVDMSESGNFASSSPSPTPDDCLLPDTAGLREGGGFYMLKKDSERKITLVNLLNDDKEQVCEKWMLAVLKDPNHKLNKNHLFHLINGFQEFFKDFGTGTLRAVIDSFREEVDYDPLAINELRLAIYVFPQIVNERLKMHKIPPHWMFALDNLLRDAVQSAITVFSPELLPMIGGEGTPNQKQNRTESFISDYQEEEPTSAASTTDSRKSPNHLRMQEVVMARARLEEEIKRMELKHLDSLRNYHQVLKAATDQLDCNTNFIRNLMALRHDPVSSAFEPPEPRHTTSHKMLPPSDGGSNEELCNWLREIGLDLISINMITREEFTKRQLLDIVTREDLRRLNLKGGMFCRLWEVIHKHRRTFE